MEDPMSADDLVAMLEIGTKQRSPCALSFGRACQEIR